MEQKSNIAFTSYAKKFNFFKWDSQYTIFSIDRKFNSEQNLLYDFYPKVKNDKKTRTKKQFIISEATEIDIIAYFEAQPNNSITNLMQESGLCLGTIHNILEKHKCVPYRYITTQTLVPGDQERRIQFCQWFIRIKSDLMAMFSRKNSHSWSRENPMLFRPCNPQRRFSVNVWCGLISSKIIGPVFYQGALTGERYAEMLTATLREFLDDLNLIDRQQMYFQHDGAPAHNIH
ncbi:hypothetical protein NQ318_022419 [Aromia moschata]|uniref:Transposase n=1 Tax=Aromia moschata TaxID=1265417 RepID=A0AAV8Z593_9CUCU|nr:hypothetical protein NQ318_022419 [Aromia moschata]